MKSTTDQLLENFYKKYPKVFDQPDDTEMVKLYITKVLGLQWNDLAELKYKMVPFESFRRKKQLKVAKGEIKVSEENKKVRHVKAERVKEEVKPQPRVIRYEFVGNVGRVIYG